MQPDNEVWMKCLALAGLIQDQVRAEIARTYRATDPTSYVTHVKAGARYTKIDVGPSYNMSGRYMVDNVTGEVFGIKGYGKVHKGHRYGTLDTMLEWDWSGYTAQRKVGV